MKSLILIIFLLIFTGLSYKTYNDFDDKVSPSFISQCSKWGGQGTIKDKFKFECVKDSSHNVELEKDYRYTFYGIVGFLALLGLLIFFSFQGNKNND